MSLRDRIRAELPAGILGERQTDRITDAIAKHAYEEISRNATIHVDGARQLADMLVAQRTGTEQGISRLALLAFVAGDRSSRWNGTGDARWVRYRGHVLSRSITPDGPVIEFTFVDHDDRERRGVFERSSRGTTTERALLMVGDIDDLLDAVIAQHGVPGDEIIDAEVVESIDSGTASRVLDAYYRFVFERLTSGRAVGDSSAKFLAAIDRGEVQP